MNDSTREGFKRTLKLGKAAFFSPAIFNIFLGKIMAGVVEEHDGKVSIGVSIIISARFANDIDALVEVE